MTPFIAHIHTDVRRARLTRRGATHTPSQVPTGTHKVYERMEQIPLPEPLSLSMTLGAALHARSSFFEVSNPYNTVTLQDVGTLLGTALRRRSKDAPNRAYPSGGGLFPVETYLISQALEGHEPALFHYNPTEHVLEKLWAIPSGTTVKDFAKQPHTHLFSTLIVFTGVWNRSSAKYGDLAYIHTLLEAGHMSENILLTATALGFHTRPMAGFDDDLLIDALDLNPEMEQPVHTITLCT